MSCHRTIIQLFAVLAVAACGDGESSTTPPTPEPARPTTVTVSPATHELTALGETVQLGAEVRDQNASVMAGATVTWTSIASSVATVNASGLVTAAGNGTATITASAGSASGSAVVTVAQVVSAIEVVSGNGQRGLTGEALSEPVMVHVLDSGEAPVSETTVTFEPGEGHGTASPAAVVSDADGQAQATWTLGEFNGTQTLTASVAGGPSITFTATAVAVVATVTITPNPADVIVGFEFQLTPSLRDRNGYEINRRTISWSSDDPSIAFVDASGVITGMSVGSTLVTATVEGLTGSTTVIVTAPIVTGIDIVAFLNQCPMSDPAYTQIREDFEVRLEGEVIVDPIICSEPAVATPSSQIPYQLFAFQIFRLAYHMNNGTRGHLPWTEEGLYDWMASLISGINLKIVPATSYCCDLIDGNLYVSTSANYFDSDGQIKPNYRNLTWADIAGILAFYAHETRHANGEHRHVAGCEAHQSFPGCDATYDLSNLGANGVEYWLNASWATGYLNVGIGCSPQAREYVAWSERRAAPIARRFVTSPPPLLTVEPPYGGPCVLRMNRSNILR